MARNSKAIALRIGPQGRVVIRAALSRELELEPGKTLMAHIDRRLVLERREQILERLREELRAAVPAERSMVDDLIAERREEAAREALDDGRGT